MCVCLHLLILRCVFISCGDPHIQQYSLAHFEPDISVLKYSLAQFGLI